jgi:fatty-acyl-CoA synthase
VIADHPAVLEVAVIAAPDERWGEVPAAFVTVHEGATVSEEDIIEHVRNRLARFKAPKSVTFGELPKTSTGKIQKFALREAAWAGTEGRSGDLAHRPAGGPPTSDVGAHVLQDARSALHPPSR